MSARRGGPQRGTSGPPRVRMPFIERLLNADPDATDISQPSAAEALERLHMAVRRSLAALLNARRRRRPVPSLLKELNHSIFTYGLPDVAAGSYNLTEQRQALAREIEATIRRFEPRLDQVSVELVQFSDEVWGTLRLKVDAVLRADPVPEPVSFETLLEPVTRIVTVRETEPL